VSCLRPLGPHPPCAVDVEVPACAKLSGCRLGACADKFGARVGSGSRDPAHDEGTVHFVAFGSAMACGASRKKPVLTAPDPLIRLARSNRLNRHRKCDCARTPRSRPCRVLGSRLIGTPRSSDRAPGFKLSGFPTGFANICGRRIQAITRCSCECDAPIPGMDGRHRFLMPFRRGDIDEIMVGRQCTYTAADGIVASGLGRPVSIRALFYYMPCPAGGSGVRRRCRLFGR